MRALSKQAMQNPELQPNSLEFLQKVINTISDPIFVKDEQHCWILCNDAFCNFIGVNRQELLGKSDYDFFPKSEADIFWKKDCQVLETGIDDENEESFTSLEGNTRNISTKKSCFQDGQGKKYIVGIIRDITRRKQVEETLKQVVEELENRVEERTAHLKQAIAQLERDIIERQLAEKQQRESQELLRLVMDNIPQLIFWKDCNSVYQGCNSNFARAAGVGEAKNIVGKTDYDLPWTKEESDWYRKCDRRVVESDTAEYHILETQKQADGKETWADTCKVPLHDAQGNVIGVLGTYEDITERKQVEALLQEKNQKLEQALSELQQAQTHLIQGEKMSSLGQLVAGVAHEINNPVNFIHGNLVHAHQYMNDLLDLLQLYQELCPCSHPDLIEKEEEIDLEFLRTDLPKLLSSMQVGADRIRAIVQSLRHFSRIDEAEVKDVDIHDGIESTLMILSNRLKAKPDRPAIEIIKQYGNLPLVECYAGQLNQVFMNIISNAIDALEERMKQEIAHQPKIWINTDFVEPNRVKIRITDNALGMPESVRKHLFNAFFTTKSIGKGTGLGMSISYQIVTDKHGGTLDCNSTFGEGTEFIVEIPIQRKA